MIKAAAESLAEAGVDQSVDKLVADAGYCSEDNLAALGGDDPDCHIATRNQRRNPKPRNGKRGPLPADASLVENMDRKVSRKAGRAIYSKRQHIIEPIFGQLKDARGIRRFSRRGKSAAQAEWKLLMATHNLLKLHRHATAQPTVVPWTRIATC